MKTVKFNGENLVKVEITNEHSDNEQLVGDISVPEHGFSGTFPTDEMSSLWDILEEDGKKYFLIPETTFDIISYDSR